MSDAGVADVFGIELESGDIDTFAPATEAASPLPNPPAPGATRATQVTGSLRSSDQSEAATSKEGGTA